MTENNTPSYSEAPFQAKAQNPRQLTEEECNKLDSDNELVTEFKQNKLEKEAKKNWDLFYKRNSTNFFKDRHWTSREFHDLLGSKNETDEKRKKVLLEVGCGVGNAVFPLLAENPHIYVYACDFSPRAVQFVKDNPLYDESRIQAFQCDLTEDQIVLSIAPESVDLVTMLFVLSAIHPDKMLQTLKNVYEVLRAGGRVLFRDYGLHDHAMLRFSRGHKLADSFYVRQDGTRAFFFSKERLTKLFEDAGFEVVINEYVLRETVNKKEGLCVPRVFVQGTFSKVCTER